MYIYHNMIDIELLIFAKIMDLLNEKDDLINEDEKLNENIDRLIDELKESRFFTKKGSISNKLDETQAELNNMKAHDQYNEILEQIVTDYGFYKNKNNFEPYYESQIYKTENYNAVRYLNINPIPDSSSESDNDSSSKSDQKYKKMHKLLSSLEKDIKNDTETKG